MKERTTAPGGRAVETVALAIIALVVAVGGKTVLADLAVHRGFAAVVIAMVIVATIVAVRRAFRLASDDTRMVVTKYVAYLVAALLALWYVVAPAKWIPGSCVAAAEVALVFDMITIVARKNVAGGT